MTVAEWFFAMIAVTSVVTVLERGFRQVVNAIERQANPLERLEADVSASRNDLRIITGYLREQAPPRSDPIEQLLARCDPSNEEK